MSTSRLASMSLLLFAMLASGQTLASAEQTVKDRYKIISVEQFELQSDVDIPPEYVSALPQEVANSLNESRKFIKVLLPGEDPAQKDAPALQLTGTITGFDKGSRAKRYFGSGMAGAARIFMTLHYLDRTDGKLIFEDKVIGTLSSGAFGGDSKNVVHELAKTVTESTKMVLLRRLSTPSNAAATMPCTAAGDSASEKQIVAIKGGDLTGAQSKLNELAAAGYRLLDFRITGNSSADATMEHCTVAPQTYQYLLVHAISDHNVQKNLSKGAAEGYRVCPHTLAPLGGIAVIMEKAPGSSAGSYEYRFHAAMRKSSAEKNMVEDQAQGFLLVKASQIAGHHVLIMEKVSTSQQAASH